MDILVHMYVCMYARVYMYVRIYVHGMIFTTYCCVKVIKNFNFFFLHYIHLNIPNICLKKLIIRNNQIF